MVRLIVAICLLSGALLHAEGLRVGAASVVVTPPPGMPMAGYYFNRAAEGTHDDLLANAVVIESAGVKAALVACDFISIARPIGDQARAIIARETGIPAGRVMISATHAHTGPVLYDAGARYKLEGEMARLAQEYSASLPSKIAASVKAANAALAPARASAGAGHEETISFNRRFFMSDGSVGWNPGKLNPKIVKPAGPIDPQVPVVYFEDGGGNPLATYVNFALHLDTVGGLEFSADYPYTLRTLLGRVKGAGMVTLFTIGSAGNLNHLNVKTREPQKGHAEAARIGTVLAGEVLKTYTRLKPVAGGLGAAAEIVKLPLAPYRPDELGKAREVAGKFGKPNAAPFLDQVWAAKVLELAGREGRPIEAEVQVLAIGKDIAWVALPGEIFVELGLAIKKASPFRHTIVVELANGSIGYVPDRKAYAEGNYEPASARCAEGSGELLVEAAARLLTKLYK